MTFEERLAGALYGVAIGDGMGAPVEGWHPDRIFARFSDHDLATFLPLQDTSRGKGEGRITDDTLMTEALMDAYAAAGGHLDAYGYAAYLTPLIQDRVVFVPERQQQMPIIERLWIPEKYPQWRLTACNAEPRTAGIGNRVNCGVAMWMMPVGAVNAGDPEGAYQEAAALGQAHNESFAVEAAAVMAAAYAAAFAPGATISDVLEASAQLARDGTRRAIEAVLRAVELANDLRTFVGRVRDAATPYDQRAAHTSDDAPLREKGLSDVGRPSRLHSIEELPVALAVLRYGDGDFRKTLRAGVFYGRDCDSIAGMSCGLFGALYGARVLPRALCDASNETNRRDFSQMATDFARTARAIFTGDVARFAARHATMEQT